MDRLIEGVNQLQVICNKLDHGKIKLDLPEIAVVGAQSSGKTSVVESLVKKDFLPRGEGIKTRCAIVIQCENIDYEEPDTGVDEWAVFGHLPKKIFVDFEEVRQEIIRRTDEIRGTNEISKDRIIVKIFSPYVVTLTLNDLPGLVEVAVTGQPETIGKEIKNLVKSYITKKTVLILAITDAGQDIGTSASLKLAAECDPKGDRTLAVLTKMDTVDPASRAAKAQVLNGSVKAVKLGIIGVINRSATDTANNKSIEEKKEEEKQFFQENYSHIAHKQGTEYLARSLSKLLGKSILKWIPNIREKIDKGIAQNQAVIDACSLPPEPLDEDGQVNAAFSALETFTDGFKAALEGSLPGLHFKNAEEGKRIYEIFYGKFPAQLDVVAKPSLTYDDIVNVIKNAIAHKTHLFTPYWAFDKLVHKYIEEIRVPSLAVADQTLIELDNIIKKYYTKMKDTQLVYPRLMDRIAQETRDFVHSRLEETKKMIESFVDCELDSPNLNHCDFDDYFESYSAKIANVFSARAASTTGAASVAGPASTTGAASVAETVSTTGESISGANSTLQHVQSAGSTISSTDDDDDSLPPNDTVPLKESKCVEKLRSNDPAAIAAALYAYITIVKETAGDMVPKLVRMYLISATAKKLLRYLHGKFLVNHSLLPELLAESPENLLKREKASSDLQSFNDAKRVLMELQGNWQNNDPD